MKTVRLVAFLVALFAFTIVCWKTRAQPKPSTSPPTPRSLAEEVRAISRRVAGHGLRLRGDSAQDDEQANQLIQIYTATGQAYAAAGETEQAAGRRHKVKLEWAQELDTFAKNHPGSPYNADIWLQLGKAAKVRSGYGQAISYYAQAWDATKNAADPPSPEMAAEASGELAKLLAETGQMDPLKVCANSKRLL
jgi:tetratricopeptide (TPR) repeat protein